MMASPARRDGRSVLARWLARRARLVGWQGTRGVLRTMPMPAGCAALVTADVHWLCEYLNKPRSIRLPVAAKIHAHRMCCPGNAEAIRRRDIT
jgi:hypothetical protein